MSREEFISELVSRGIATEIVSFDDSFSDGYGIRRVWYRWEIFYRERGREFYTKGYPSESDALIALLDDIVNARS